MIKSAIEWTETTWSPVIGCTKVSQGCKHCYAEREVETRWSKNPKSIWYGRSFGDVLCREDAIGEPLTWRKPRRIFVCPRADLFHEAVPDDFILAVFTVMAACPQHTYQVLTKRAARMQKLLSAPFLPGWPFANVQLGVSVEDQATADERIPLLLDMPAATRWISAEPLLGQIDLRRWIEIGGLDTDRGLSNPGLDWVVAGGESGPQARPMHPDWVRSLRDQCAAAGVPFLFKQWGEWVPSNTLPKDTLLPSHRWAWANENGGPHPTGFGQFKDEHAHHELMGRVGKAKAGRLLDGVMHDEYPRVQP